jgi:hypothetical protein
MAVIVFRVCKVCKKNSMYTLSCPDGAAICRWCARARDIAEGKSPLQWTRLPN